MKRTLLVFTISFCVSNMLISQNIPGTTEIDKLIMRGDYEKVVDTCTQVLLNDALNPDIHYKMGLAYLNLLDEDRALKCFYSAASLSPENRNYQFMLARAYYSRGKYKQAEPLLENLVSLDSMKWIYSYYLTSIMMQTSRYNDAIKIYNRFLTNDSANYILLDKMAFAHLKRGDLEAAINFYNKSLAINRENAAAIKNLAYLYTATGISDLAIYVLTRGIETDSSDMDLYARRAQVLYSKGDRKKALDDYLVILASGDSTTLYLKRTGIGFCYSLRFGQAIPYLLNAYLADSSDYETSSYLGQCYYRIRDMQKSTYYYNRAIQILLPLKQQLGMSYGLCGNSQSAGADYKASIESYLKAQNEWPSPDNFMKIANIYDEKLNDTDNAIRYYERFLNNLKAFKEPVETQYIEAIQKRVDFLKKRTPEK